MNNIEVVIPTLEQRDEDIRTLDSIPDGVEVNIERSGSLNAARNCGVENADAEYVLIMDDDIAFPAEVFWRVVERIEPGTLVGIADWDFGWVAGRVMGFTREDWRAVGGFDTYLQSHGGDTDFALKFVKSGRNLERIPREVFHHEEHDRSITTWDRAWRGVYLAMKHPRYSWPLFKGVAL